MTVLLGAISASSLGGTVNANLTPAMAAYDGPYWPTHQALTAAPVSNFVTSQIPVAAPGYAIPGSVSPGYAADYYDTIWVRPSSLDLGNLLSSQQRDIEVWNAWRVPRTLAAIDATNADGLDLIAPEPAPTTFGALESRVYTLNIALDGPATIDASFEFEFEAVAPALTVTGSRVVIFAVSPDWAQPVTERLEWLTDVLESYGGIEQRRSLRSAPRRRFEYALFAREVEAAYLDALLAAWQARVYALPVWTDAGRLAADLPAGATAIAIPTAYLDYHEGGLAILAADPRHADAVEISAVAADGLTLKRATLNTWPAGTRVYPARLARLPASVSINHATAAHSRGTLVFDLADRTDIAPVESAAALDGVPVNEQHHNWAAAVSQDYTREVETFDSQLAIAPLVDDGPDRSFGRRRYRYTLAGRADIADFRAWLAARQGRLNACYQPTWQADLTLTAVTGATSTQLTIERIGAALYTAAKPPRAAVRIALHDGTIFYRQITAAVTGADPDTELLAMDSALGMAVGPDDVRLISWMALARLDADAIEIAWQTDALAQVDLALREVAA